MASDISSQVFFSAPRRSRSWHLATSIFLPAPRRSRSWLLVNKQSYLLFHILTSIQRRHLQLGHVKCRVPCPHKHSLSVHRPRKHPTQASHHNYSQAGPAHYFFPFEHVSSVASPVRANSPVGPEPQIYPSRSAPQVCLVCPAPQIYSIRPRARLYIFALTRATIRPSWAHQLPT